MPHHPPSQPRNPGTATPPHPAPQTTLSTPFVLPPQWHDGHWERSHAVPTLLYAVQYYNALASCPTSNFSFGERFFQLGVFAAGGAQHVLHAYWLPFVDGEGGGVCRGCAGIAARGL